MEGRRRSEGPQAGEQKEIKTNNHSPAETQRRRENLIGVSGMICFCHLDRRERSFLPLDRMEDFSIRSK